MAKINQGKNPNTPSPTYQVPAKEFSPEWFEANKEAMEAAGYKLVTQDEFRKQTYKQTEVEQAAKEVLGLDLNEKSAVREGDTNLLDLWTFLAKSRDQYEMIMQSTQFRSLMSPKDQTAVYAVRTFLRQCFNERAPRGQASTMREVIGAHAKIPDGVLADRVRPDSTREKAIRLNASHLKAAGVI